MFSANTSQVSADTVYIEDVFSTYLYTTTGSTMNVVNGIDLAGKGGLVWAKRRTAVGNHGFTDTARGAGFYVESNSTSAQASGGSFTTAFNSNGYATNASAGDFVGWTFREQPKFFDVVTYTGNGANRTIAHNLGSVPGCIMVKCLSTGATSWAVYHRSLANTQYLVLNDTAAEAAGTTYWNSTTPTSAVFSLGTNATVNSNGATYVAYLFAHDAGGFGLSGTDNVISCGSYVGNGSLTGPNVNLGYEPQWLLVKNATTAGPNWFLFDNMRGVVVGGNDARLVPNTSDAESSSLNLVEFNATGFQLTYNGNAINGSGDTYIYIAIRRGPMKVPTSGTSVFTPITYVVSGGGTGL